MPIFDTTAAVNEKEKNSDIMNGNINKEKIRQAGAVTKNDKIFIFIIFSRKKE